MKKNNIKLIIIIILAITATTLAVWGGNIMNHTQILPEHEIVKDALKAGRYAARLQFIGSIGALVIGYVLIFVGYKK